MARKKWSDLPPGQQRAIVVLGAVEAVLKLAMLLDLRRRPQESVRGPKRLWAAAAMLNTAGILPIVYFVAGRRPPEEVPEPRPVVEPAAT